MAAGNIVLDIKDAANVTRKGRFRSSDGTVAGDLQPLGRIDDGDLEALGSKADAAAGTDGATASLIALFKRLLGKLPLALGSGTKAQALLVTLATDDPLISAAIPAGEAHIGEVSGRCVVVSANFARPGNTTKYDVGDLVANNTAAGSVVALNWDAARVNGGSGMIRRARLTKSSTTLANAAFRLHLYANDPAAAAGITNGDNGVWLTKVAGYLGSIDIAVDKGFSDGAVGVGVPTEGGEINFVAAAGTKKVYGLIEDRGGYTPASAENIAVDLEVLPN